MTREEAIKAFEEIKASAQSNLGTKHAVGCDGYYRDRIELAEAALKALRPVGRERVEEMWRSEWEDMRETYKDVPKCRCAQCRGVFIGIETSFCPACGAPMTDKAVQMVMDRLNKLTSEEENNGKMHPLRKGPGNPGEDR